MKKQNAVFVGVTFLLLFLNDLSVLLFIYSAFIPFYIPIIFFAKSVLQALPSLAVFFLPQLIFILMGIADTAREFKAQRHKEETERREREEQERREELGAWK